MHVPEVVKNLWNKYNLPENVRLHSIEVAKLALEIAEKAKANGYDVDLEAVKVGALLHDIGRVKTHGLEHFVVSGEILRNEGIDEKITRIAERHFSCGVTAEEAKTLGLPEKDFMPKTLEEKIVAFADNLIFDRKRVSFDEFFEKLKELKDNVEPEKRWVVENSLKRALKMKEELEKISGMRF
jgi:uncharacterized protein